MSEPLVSVDPASVPAPTIIDATTGQIIKPTVFQTIVADAEAVVAKVEEEFHTIEASLWDGNGVAIPAVPASAPMPAAFTPTVITKVGELLALSGRTPVAFAEIAALAVVSAASFDIDAVLAKLKDLVAYSGTNTDVWDQVVAVAKAL